MGERVSDEAKIWPEQNLRKLTFPQIEETKGGTFVFHQ